MAKPVIWTVDDDPDVLRAVERDLRRHYGDRYRVISADSGGVIDDLLDDWQASYRLEFQGVRVVGNQWAPHSTEVRDFLGGNFVPHQWLNVETDEDAKQLLTTAGGDAASLPLVVFPDGSFLPNP